MNNYACDLFYKLLDYQCDKFKANEKQRDNIFRDLDKDIQPFINAVQKFSKTGKVDEEALKINLKQLNIVLEQENGGSKRGRRKKMSTVTESNIENIEPIKVKKEKISMISETSGSSATSSVVDVHTENVKLENDEMPAPTWIPPPKKNVKNTKDERPSIRPTRTKGRKAAEAAKARDSDVIIENPPTTFIDLLDSEESDAPKKEVNMRTTRTKTRKQTQVSNSGSETANEDVRSTRTKTRGRKEESKSEEPEVTRSTRTKTLRKGNKTEDESEKEEPANVQQETRSTRTKTIRKAPAANELNENVAEPKKSTRARKPPEQEAALKEIGKLASNSKRNRSDSTDEELTNDKDRKKTKSSSPARDNQTNTTAYEDARSTLGPSKEKPLNTTFVTAKPSAEAHVNSTVVVESKADATVVVDHPKFNIFDKKSTDDLFTDDESMEANRSPKKAPIPKTNQVFSPYEKTTLKKKVEAFEKLQNGREIPIKIGKNSRGTPSSVKEKARIFTPSGLKFLPSSSSTSKISRFLSNQQHNSVGGNDSFFKSAQKDPRDHQKKLLEREQALKKKEAMLTAQSEAKRKLNEEKQLKAQQQRKALEAEKLKHLEVQKQKEEKLKQREQEREEYLQKQKQETEKKRLVQKKKIQEIQAQKQRQMQAEQEKNKPIYMVTKLPRLPTEDCYDSDDPDYKKAALPSWCSSDQTKIIQLAMLTAGEKIKNTLFSRRAQTPDLRDIFETIDPKKLKRSSSILWKKPPRYTMMPDLNETKFSEDEELYDSD